MGACAGALLFLLHPVQVETVVWISQRKNLLAMFFFLLAWESYCTYRENAAASRRYQYIASLLFLLLALLSKSVAVIFPIVILLFDYCYPSINKRFNLRDKLPYILISAFAAVLAIISQTPDPLTGSVGGLAGGYHGGTPVATFLTMLPVLIRYMRMVVWPTNLSALYDPPIHKNLDPTVLTALFFLCVTGFIIYKCFKFNRKIAFWPIYFFIALLPVSQIIPMVTLINDRYLYFPLIGVAGLLGYGVRQAHIKWDFSPLVIVPCLTVLIISLSILSFNRSNIWVNSITLWNDAVRKSPKLPLAWEALGEAYHYTPHPDRERAKKAYLQAIKLSPMNDLSRYNLGILYMDQYNFDEAEIILKELLKLSPEHVTGLTAFGDLAMRRNKLKEAESYYRKAYSLQPEAVEINQKLGNLMVVTGRIDEARSFYMRIEKLQWETDPSNAYELAKIEAITGNTNESIKWLDIALQRGYNDYYMIMNDEEMAPVRVDARFSELAQKYFPHKR